MSKALGTIVHVLYQVNRLAGLSADQAQVLGAAGLIASYSPNLPQGASKLNK